MTGNGGHYKLLRLQPIDPLRRTRSRPATRQFCCRIELIQPVTPDDEPAREPSFGVLLYLGVLLCDGAL